MYIFRVIRLSIKFISLQLFRDLIFIINFIFKYSGVYHLSHKFLSENDSNKYPSLPILIITVYIGSYTFSNQVYESSLTRAQSTIDSALGRVNESEYNWVLNNLYLIRNNKIPPKPDWLSPRTIFSFLTNEKIKITEEPRLASQISLLDDGIYRTFLNNVKEDYFMPPKDFDEKILSVEYVSLFRHLDNIQFKENLRFEPRTPSYFSENSLYYPLSLKNTDIKFIISISKKSLKNFTEISKNSITYINFENVQSISTKISDNSFIKSEKISKYGFIAFNSSLHFLYYNNNSLDKNNLENGSELQLILSSSYFSKFIGNFKESEIGSSNLLFSDITNAYFPCDKMGNFKRKWTISRVKCFTDAHPFMSYENMMCEYLDEKKEMVDILMRDQYFRENYKDYLLESVDNIQKSSRCGPFKVQRIEFGYKYLKNGQFYKLSCPTLGNECIEIRA